MGSGRKKILWLASWYPNRHDAYDGDFVQRHARAAALFNDIHVIVVKESSTVKEVETDWTTSAGLTEQIIYFNPGHGWFSGLRKQLRWRSIYLQAVYEYIKNQEKPELVHVQVPWKAGLIALELKLRLNLKYIVTEHWTIYNDGSPSTYERSARALKKSLQLIYKRSSCAVTVSSNLGMVLSRLFPIKNIRVIHN